MVVKFVGFKKMYESVDRDILINVLKIFGTDDKMTIQQTHDHK